MNHITQIIAAIVLISGLTACDQSTNKTPGKSEEEIKEAAEKSQMAIDEKTLISTINLMGRPNGNWCEDELNRLGNYLVNLESIERGLGKYKEEAKVLCLERRVENLEISTHLSEVPNYLLMCLPTSISDLRGRLQLERGTMKAYRSTHCAL